MGIVSASSVCGQVTSDLLLSDSHTLSPVLPLPELQDLYSCGVLDAAGNVNPFSRESVEFMLASLPISSTPVHCSDVRGPRVVTGSSITLHSGDYCQLSRLAKGGFASVYAATDSSGVKKVLKVCWVHVHRALGDP